MRGTMLWFNSDKDLGVIEAHDGERLPVQGADFAAGARPGLRCRGTAVEFRIVDADDRHAASVSLLPDVAPRRARRRTRRSYA